MISRYNTISMYLKLYPITSIIIILHVFFYIFMWIPMIPHQRIYQELVGVNLNISEGEVWRLITPMFIHLNFAHFFYNTLSIAIMGPFIENLAGKWKFSLLYIISGFAGNLATLLFLPLSYAHVGSSGAILGLFGCFFLFVLQKKFFISKQNQVVILAIIAISVFMTIFQTDVNITAHLAGLLTGLFFGWSISLKK